MLYKKRDEEILKDELFKNPTKEYRGAPFWAWNTKPEKESMKRQMKAFDDMGFGGFHIHSRTGLDVEYLGDEFMDDVKFCTEYAKKIIICLCGHMMRIDFHRDLQADL